MVYYARGVLCADVNIIARSNPWLDEGRLKERYYVSMENILFV